MISGLALSLAVAGTVLADPTSTERDLTGSHKLVVIDMTGEMDTGHYILPSTTEHDGDIYTIKVRNNPGYSAEVYPAEGDTFDLGDDGMSFLTLYPGTHSSINLAADADNDTWYLINSN